MTKKNLLRLAAGITIGGIIALLTQGKVRKVIEDFRLKGKIKATIENLKMENFKNHATGGETVDEIVRIWAKWYRIPHEIAVALIAQESSGMVRAYRPELGYYEKYIKPSAYWKENPYYNEPERISASYGLTQVLYTTAYELAKELDILERLTKPEDLYNPDLNCRLGFYYLKKLLDKHKNNVKNALREYNGGPGFKKKPITEKYANEVMSMAVDYKRVYG